MWKPLEYFNTGFYWIILQDSAKAGKLAVLASKALTITVAGVMQVQNEPGKVM